MIKAQQAAFQMGGGGTQTQLVCAPDMSDKVLLTLQQHLCVTCVLAHCSTSDGQTHAELMDSMPLQPLPMDLPP